MNTLKKIVAIGPESTGKSTLCNQLARHYDTVWVREYAREFINRHQDYNYEDLLTIAKRQIAQEDRATRDLLEKSALYFPGKTSVKEAKTTQESPQLLFVDTDLYVMQVWCEYVYNRCHNWILSQIATRQYEGYLLCNVDLPWEQDGMREYPDKRIREKLFRYYKELMINQSVPWIEVSGNPEERFSKALGFVKSL